MRKNILIVAGISIFILTCLVLFVELKQTSTKNPIPNNFPTPTPITAPFNNLFHQEKLQVVATTPTDNATQLPQNQKITITFNQTISPSEISFSISPQIPFTLTNTENVLTLTPQATFAANFVYTYTITNATTQEILATRSFSIQGTQQPTKPLQGRYQNLEEDANSFQKQSYPDVYLSNQVPYSTSTFSVTASYASSPTGHYYFTVNALTADTAKAKQDFITWVKSFGITDGQINGLDIRYNE